MRNRHFVLETLYIKAKENAAPENAETQVQFSVVGLYQEYKAVPRLDLYKYEVSLADIEDALLYLSKIGAVSLQAASL